jgi:hypothetical protein
MHTVNQSPSTEKRFSNICNSPTQESAYTSVSSPTYKELHSSREMPFPEADFYQTQKLTLSTTVKQNACNNVEIEDTISLSKDSMKKLSMQKLDGPSGLQKSTFLDLNGGEILF